MTTATGEKTMTTIEIDGCEIEHDKSGSGHAWVAATADNCPANIVDEIAAQIIDGGKTRCDGHVASNGLRYRWVS